MMKKSLFAIAAVSLTLSACQSKSSATDGTTVAKTTTQTTKTTQSTTTSKQSTTSTHSTTTTSAAGDTVTTRQATTASVSQSTPTTQANTPAMDLAAIQAGDTASIAGTWQNQNGGQLIINADGTYYYNGDSDLFDINISKQQNYEGVLAWYMKKHDGSLTAASAMFFAPKGSSLSFALSDGGDDPTDETKDRIFGAQALTSEGALERGTYYRVN